TASRLRTPERGVPSPLGQHPGSLDGHGVLPLAANARGSGSCSSDQAPGSPRSLLDRSLAQHTFNTDRCRRCGRVPEDLEVAEGPDDVLVAVDLNDLRLIRAGVAVADQDITVRKHLQRR